MTAHTKPPQAAQTALPNDLDAYWMPFTPNRRFKADPRFVDRAEGMYYYTPDDRKVLDGASGLWCVNAGHGHPRIVEAIQRQAAELGYATSFNMGHPKAFEFASRLAALLPGDIDRVFFTNSGSESADTALKIALAYQRARGKGSKTRLIGRERGYHGVGFGGISVGGMVSNRKQFGTLLAGVDHLPHTHDLARNAFSRGQPAHGAELADALESLVALHDASTIAAVIVEPVAGSAGVLVPPQGYLQRLRALCDKHDILLIFDEVITGFGRLGTSFGAEKFGVLPDIMGLAKGITNAAVPMGAVGVRRQIYDTLMGDQDLGVELFHGYTYSGHPLACAAGLATLDVYRDEGLFERSAQLAPVLEELIHGLRGARHVIDVRNIGLMAAVEMAPRPDAVGARGQEAFKKMFERGVLGRVTGDSLAFSPALVAEPHHLETLIGVTREVLETVD
jgi:beta-alanine--pyruvate transaminase